MTDRGPLAKIVSNGPVNGQQAERQSDRGRKLDFATSALDEPYACADGDVVAPGNGFHKHA